MQQFRRTRDSIEVPFIKGDTGALEEVDQFLPKAHLANCDVQTVNAAYPSCHEMRITRPTQGQVSSVGNAFTHPSRGTAIGWGRVTGGVRFARPPANFFSPFGAGCGWMSCAARGGGLWWLDTQRADTADTSVRVAAMSSGDAVAVETRRPR